MTQKSYRALVVRETEDKKFTAAIEELPMDALPAGEVLVRVCYSSINYKDMLSASGNRGVTKRYPHTPGIDAAGVVEQSADPTFKVGEEVIVTSYDLGMNTAGGLSEYIRVPAAWVVKKPAGLTLRESMIFGTAGFTAALSVLKLKDYGLREGAEILVTGASGGVGSVAVSILAGMGCRVTAMKGLRDESEFLKSIGASEVIDIPDPAESKGRPLLKDRWDAAVDTVGGEVLSFAIRSVKANGAVTCCGNAGSADLSLTVYPFILRGATLFGIDSQNCNMAQRIRAWELLAGSWKVKSLESLASEVGLGDVVGVMDSLRSGTHRGRTIVKIKG